MANRIMLNETSYHGAGAVSAIPGELKARGLKKAAGLLRPLHPQARRGRRR